MRIRRSVSGSACCCGAFHNVLEIARCDGIDTDARRGILDRHHARELIDTALRRTNEPSLGTPTIEAIEEMSTIEPPAPAPSSIELPPGTRASRRTNRHRAPETSSSPDLIDRLENIDRGVVTNTSSRPSWSVAWRTNASQLWPFVTSSAVARAWRPSAWMAAAVSRAPAALTSPTRTAAPCAANPRASVRPRPRAVPVTATTRPRD